MKSYLSAALNTSLPSQLLSPKMDRGSGSGASGFNDSLSERSLLPTAKLLCVRPSVYFGSSCEGENMMDDGLKSQPYILHVPNAWPSNVRRLDGCCDVSR